MQKSQWAIDTLAESQRNRQRFERLQDINADLLAALEAALEICEGYDDRDQELDPDEDYIVKPVVDQARAAIAKARPETKE